MEKTVGYTLGYNCPFVGAIALDPNGLGWAAGHSAHALATLNSGNLCACARTSKIVMNYT